MGKRCLLYYITDRNQFRGDEPNRRRDLLAKIVEAARAGVDYIQLREKDLSTRGLEIFAADAIAAMRDSVPLSEGRPEPGTRLLINSRTDIALAVGADGVHLRSDDIPAAYVRSIWALGRAGDLARDRPSPSSSPRIAVSCHDRGGVDRAQAQGADFAVFAPVFEKQSVPGSRPTGLAALRDACEAEIPVFALGGVTIENAASCRNAGAAGIAAIRLFQENKIEDVVRVLRAF